MLDSQTVSRATLILLLLVVLCGPAHPQGRPTLEGNRPYTPTRLEWLAVELNAESRVDLSESTGYMMQFIPIGSANTIMIYVKYLPSVNREVMNMAIDTARKVIAIETKSRGWSSWLKVTERVEMGKPDAVSK
jgi:hypothetical protein